MRILLVNPPVLRSENSSAENDFRLKGIVKTPFRSSIRGFHFLLRHLGLENSIEYGVRAGSRWPWTQPAPPGAIHYPFMMGYASSFLRAHGHATMILDSIAEEDYSYSSFFKKVKRYNPELIIFEISTPTLDIDMWIAGKLAADYHVALAGPHRSLESNCASLRDALPNVLFFLPGEYIRSALRVANTMEAGTYAPDIVGNLDDIPMPDRSFPVAHNYYDPSMPTPRPQLQLYASKGCPFQCIYCWWPKAMYGGKYSARSPQCVEKEIRFCIDTWGYKSIFFDDDTFNIGDDRIAELCERLRRIGLPWSMMGRLDTSSREIFDTMVACGCVGMRFGVETFNSDIRHRIGKGLNDVAVDETLGYIASRYPGLMIHLTMMKNLPGQDEAIHAHDMSLLRQHGFSVDNPLRHFQLSSCMALPGTALHEHMCHAQDGGGSALGQRRTFK